MKKMLKIKIIFSLAIIIGVFFVFNFSQAVTTNQDFPRTLNYYLSWTLTETQAKELAKWDVVVMDMEIQERHPDLLKKMRVWNPKIVLFAYITPQEIKNDAITCSSLLRRQLVSGFSEDFYLKNSRGERLSWWPGTYLLNVYNANFRNYLVNFVTTKLLATGYWDGVFYDNTWDSVSWFAGTDVDLDNNGMVDTGLDQKWQEGMKTIYNNTRLAISNRYVIVGNGTTRAYNNELNGKMIENFSAGPSWSPTMNTYSNNESNVQSPQFNLINANTKNTGVPNYRDMRFGLSSTLLKNGYFSYDYGDQNHGQTWWYDEYNVNLGNPTGVARSNSGATIYKPDVWRRDFDNGLAVVNSTGETKNIDLGGDFEKIRGTQDKIVNDGAIVSNVSVAPNDGQIMLKAISSLDNVLFRNGDFVRFFDAKGQKTRNGFFVFEDGYQGGDRIGKIDINGNGQKDLLVVSGSKIKVWRDDGQIMLNVYPYGADFVGEIKMALGDLNSDGKMEIIVGPSTGYKLPIKIYSYDGSEYKDAWLPLGAKYKNGYSLALGNINGGSGRIVVGTGKGAEPRVSVYNDKFGLQKTWLAFEKGFLGGVNVATGNVDGAPGDEVIVGAGKGGWPIIKVYDFFGKQLYTEFRAYQASARNGIEVMAADVNFDGKADIIAESSGF